MMEETPPLARPVRQMTPGGWTSRRASAALAMLVLSAAVLLAGCSLGGDRDSRRAALTLAGGNGSVSVVGSTTMVRPEEAPAGANTADIKAARNEYESFQVVIKAGGNALNGVDVQLNGALTGPGDPITGDNVRIYREDYYTVVRPSNGELWQQDPCPSKCRIPDALIPQRDVFHNEPRNAFPINIPANENRVAWVDVLVPKGQPAGRYSGSLTVSGGGTNTRVDIGLTVMDFELPSEPSLKGAFSADWHRLCETYGGDRNNCGNVPGGAWEMYEKYVRAGLNNRITISNPGFGSPVGGNVADFRTHARPALAGTARTHLPGAKLTDIVLARYEADNMDEWKTEGAAGDFLPRITAYCDEVGMRATSWTEICDNEYRVAKANWERTAPGAGPLPLAITATEYELAWARGQNYTAARDATTLIPNVVRMHPTGGYRPQVNGQFLEGNQREKYNAFLAERGDHRLWTYTSCASVGCTADYTPQTVYGGWPGYHIDQSPSKARAVAWQAFNYKATGDYFYEVFIDLARAWNCDRAAKPYGCQYEDGGNGDGTLFYPGKTSIIGGQRDIPVESLRLKRARDGREDYEYLMKAVKAGNEQDARAIAGGPYGDGGGLFRTMYESNAAQVSFDRARDMVIELIGAEAPPPAPPARTCQGEPVTRAGTAGDDTLAGTAGNDVMHGFEGNDTLSSRGGADRMCGGEGYDVFHPGAQSTSIDGEGGATTTYDGGIVDYIDSASQMQVSLASGIATGDGIQDIARVSDAAGSPYNDGLHGNAFHNWIVGRGGNDTITGLAGNDKLYGDAGADKIEGGDGNDTIGVQGDGSVDEVSCGIGADTVSADREDRVAADCESVTRPADPPPTDSDGDGVPDVSDRCPTLKGPAPEGCPEDPKDPEDPEDPKDPEDPRDTTAPGLTLGAKQTQALGRAGAVAVTAACDEGCTLTAAGRVTGTALRLTGARATAREGQRVTLRLRLSPRVRAAVLRSLARRRRVVLAVTVSAADDAGNVKSARRNVRLTR